MADVKLSITVNSVIDNLSDSGLAEGEPEINIFTTDGTLKLIDGGYLITFTEEQAKQCYTYILIQVCTVCMAPVFKHKRTNSLIIVILFAPRHYFV